MGDETATVHTESKRLATLKALTSFLRSEVAVANGYKHDLTEESQVSRGRMFYTKNEPLPQVSILENIDPDRYPRVAGGRDYDMPVTAEEWVLLLNGWVEDDKVNPTDPAYELMADVRKALAKLRRRPRPDMADFDNPHFNLGGLISGLSLEAGIARPPIEQVSEKAMFWMRVKLKFTEDQNDPYLY